MPQYLSEFKQSARKAELGIHNSKMLTAKQEVTVVGALAKLMI